MMMDKLNGPRPEFFEQMAKSLDVASVPSKHAATLIAPFIVVVQDQRYFSSANLTIAAMKYGVVLVEKCVEARKLETVIPRAIFMEIFMRIGVICDCRSFSVSDMEEISLHAFSLLETLLKTVPPSYLFPLFTARALPTLGHLVSLLISMTESALASPGLKISTLRCLNELTKAHEDEEHFDHIQAVSIATFMPGLLVVLTKILGQANDPRSNRSFSVEAFKVFRNIIVSVLNDANLKAKEIAQIYFEKCPSEGLQRLKTSGVLPELPFSEKYLTVIGEKISPVVSKVFNPIVYASDKQLNEKRIMHAAFDASQMILIKSSRFLTDSAVSSLLCCAVANPQLDDDLIGVIRTSHKLGDLAEDRFLELLRSFPLFLKDKTINFESILSSRLSSLNGFINLLGKVQRLGELFCSHECLNDFINFAIRTCQLKELNQNSFSLAPAPPNSEVLAQQGLGDDNFWGVVYPLQNLPFKYLENPGITAVLIELINNFISQIDDHKLVLTHILENTRKFYHPPGRQFGLDSRFESAMIVLALCLNAASYLETDALETIAITSVEHFCSEPLDFISNRASLNLLMACSKVMAKSCVETQSSIIRTTILPVLESCSSGKPFIENHSVHCLRSMALATGCNCLAEFIAKNADYLSNSFVLRLQRLVISKQVLYSMAAAFRFSSPETLPFFADPLREVIKHIPQSDDDHELSGLLLLTLNHALRSILSWKLEYVESSASGDLPPDFDEETSENSNMVPVPVDTSKAEVPLHIALARDSADAAVVLFSSHAVNIRLMAMDCAIIAVQIVKPSTNQLLPLVHRLWSSTAARCVPFESRKQVVIKSIDLIKVLAECSEDFIRHRFVSGIFPYICKTIDHLTETMSKPNTKLNVYRQTFDYKLLMKLVVDVPRIAKLVQMTADKDLATLLTSLLSAFVVSLKFGNDLAKLSDNCLEGVKILHAFEFTKTFISHQWQCDEKQIKEAILLKIC